MAARARRDEVIALVLLIVLAALITVVIALVEPEGTSTSVGPNDGDPTTAAPDPASQVLVGSDPFVYACRAVSRDDMIAIFGEFGSQGYVRQQYLTRTLTPTEFTGARAFSYGGLSTACTYWRDDAGAHSLRATLTQFPTDRPADRRWRQLSDAGRTVPGAAGRLVYQAASGSFVIRDGRILVEARYAADDGDAETSSPPAPMSRREAERQFPRMLALADAVERNIADGTAVDGPRPTDEDAPDTVGGTAYVEPCDVLDPETLAALGVTRPEPVAVDTSVIEHDPYTGAAVSSCERSGTVHPTSKAARGARTFAVLEIRYAADEAGAEAVRERHLQNRYGRHVDITTLDSDEGTIDVVEPRSPKVMQTRIAHAVVGPYELTLAAVREVSTDDPTGRPPTDDQLVAAVAALAARVAAVAPTAAP